jgi:hypothetical protein
MNLFQLKDAVTSGAHMQIGEGFDEGDPMVISIIHLDGILNFHVDGTGEAALLNYLLGRAGKVAVTLEEMKDITVMRNNHEGFIEEIEELKSKVAESAKEAQTEQVAMEIPLRDVQMGEDFWHTREYAEELHTDDALRITDNRRFIDYTSKRGSNWAGSPESKVWVNRKEAATIPAETREARPGEEPVDWGGDHDEDTLWESYEAGFIQANRVCGKPKDFGECKTSFKEWLAGKVRVAQERKVNIPVTIAEEMRDRISWLLIEGGRNGSGEDVDKVIEGFRAHKGLKTMTHQTLDHMFRNGEEFTEWFNLNYPKI